MQPKIGDVFIYTPPIPHQYEECFKEGKKYKIVRFDAQGNGIFQGQPETVSSFTIVELGLHSRSNRGNTWWILDTKKPSRIPAWL
jgi:hypothetical protein